MQLKILILSKLGKKWKKILPFKTFNSEEFATKILTLKIIFQSIMRLVIF